MISFDPFFVLCIFSLYARCVWMSKIAVNISAGSLEKSAEKCYLSTHSFFAVWYKLVNMLAQTGR